jgi:formylglycine-generating enzyme required for sulfatase activity
MESGFARKACSSFMKHGIAPGVLAACIVATGMPADGATPAKRGDARTIGGMEFVYIAGGSFMMGTPDPSHDNWDNPAHRVTVDGFWMGRYEVTHKQYRDLTGLDPCGKNEWGRSVSRCGDDHPIHNVSGEDADAFCMKFSNTHGVSARLPYEAEWEYACRAGTTTRYYWGDTMNGDHCWYRGNSGETAHPVGTTKVKANPWGLSDMSGNVWEWCIDYWGFMYYLNSPEINPRGPETGRDRIMRGGSWVTTDEFLCSALRNTKYPGSRDCPDTGFRVVVVGN